LRRSAAWVFYDPSLITNWAPPGAPPTRPVISATFFPPLLVVILTLAGVVPTEWRWFWIALSLWWSSSVPARAMFSGNSHPLLPKLMLAVSAALVGVQLFRWYQAPNAGWGARYLMELIGACGVLLWALPPLPGPVVNRRANVFEAEDLPPMNLGATAVSVLGALCFAVGVVGLVVVLVLVPVATTASSAVSAAGPSAAEGTSPPGAQGATPGSGWLAFLDNLWIVALIAFVIALMFGNFGSFSSIRGPWHSQTIYHRCVMPNVMKVTALPQTAAFLAGLVVYWLLARLLLLGAVPALIAAVGVTAGLAFFGARRRGLRIYTAAVRQIDPCFAP
jgi:hypothetical protein